MCPWQLGPHGKPSRVSLQSLLGLCGPLLTPQCHSSSVVPKAGCPYAKRGLPGDPGSLSGGGGGAALRAVSRAGYVGTNTQRRLSSPKVVPRQPHPRPSRAHADEGAAGRSLPGAQEERAQLLRHLLSVRPGRSEVGRGAGREQEPWGGCPCAFLLPGCARGLFNPAPEGWEAVLQRSCHAADGAFPASCEPLQSSCLAWMACVSL